MCLTAMYGADLGLDLGRLAAASDVVAAVTRVPLPPVKPIVGSFVGAWEFADKLLTMPEMRSATMPFLPEAVGRADRVVLGQASDIAAIEIRLRDLGRSASVRDMEAIRGDVRAAAREKGRLLEAREFAAIVDRILGPAPS